MLTYLISHFAVTGGCQEPQFFGLRPWFHYLKTDDQCNVIDFQFLPTDGKSDLLLILLAVVDDLLRIAGFVAIGFIIYGGLLYVTSQGSPEQTQKAQQTIQNALIGLGVAVVAIATVSFFGSRIG